MNVIGFVINNVVHEFNIYLVTYKRGKRRRKWNILGTFVFKFNHTKKSERKSRENNVTFTHKQHFITIIIIASIKPPIFICYNNIIK